MSPQLTVFDRIYVINVPTRTDRRREMQAQLYRVGTSLSAPGVHLFSAVRPSAAGGFTSVGARGCFVSHLGVLREAAPGHVGRLLILEDDLDFVRGFETRGSKWDFGGYHEWIGPMGLT